MNSMTRSVIYLLIPLVAFFALIYSAKQASSWASKPFFEIVGASKELDLDENKRLEWIAIEAGKPKYLEEHSFRQRTENYLLLFHACIWLIIFYATARSLGQRINT